MDVVVKKSTINKKGVFTNRKFKKGEVVLKWNPKLLSESEVKKLPKEKRHYLFYDDNAAYLMQSPEKYVNHSCETNTKTKNLASKKVIEISLNFILGGLDILFPLLFPRIDP